jgi:polyisoprenoid-binding protein YceI
MKTTLIALSCLALVGAAACDNPAKDSAKAQVGAAMQAPSQPVAGAEAYTFSNADSKVQFVGSKVTGKHEGSFNTFSGTVSLVDKEPTKSSVKVDIQADSLTTDSDKLIGHLKSPDFFDVANHPVVRFQSTSVRAGGDKGATHTITGNLEMRGVTKSITFPATVRATADSVQVDAEFAINRKDFGMVYAGKADDLIRDDVLVKLEIRAKHQ